MIAPASFPFLDNFSQFTFGPLSFQSREHGVGHISLRFFSAFRLLLPPSRPVQFGVWKKVSPLGDNPDALSAVRSSDINCSQHSPSRMKPHRGQVSEYGSKSPRSEHW